LKSGSAAIEQLARTFTGRDSWGADCSLPRHRHFEPYAALILSGGYEESGSFGRYRVRAGQVLLHRMFDAHFDRFHRCGACVLNLLLDEDPDCGLGSVADPDAIARLAEADSRAATAALKQQLCPLESTLSPTNVFGWLFFEGVYVGPTEEIPFRALLVTYLAATMPGKLRIGRFAMNWAGVIVALILALLHATNFDLRAWPMALGQQVYAFLLGVLYAYWLEKSGSVVASSIGHNVSDGVEYALLFGWIALL